MKSEMTEEEKRLDRMMEVDRQNAIVVQEEIERRRRDDKLFGATKLLEQIEENEQARLFELEKKDQENVQMQKYIDKLMEEDIADLERKKRDQGELRVSRGDGESCGWVGTGWAAGESGRRELRVSWGTRTGRAVGESGQG